MDLQSTCLSPNLEDLQSPPDCSLTTSKDPESCMAPASHEGFGDGSSASFTWDKDAELSSTAFAVPGSNDFISLPMPLFNLSQPLIQLEICQIFFLLEVYLFYVFNVPPSLSLDCSPSESSDSEQQQLDLLIYRLLCLLPNDSIYFLGNCPPLQSESPDLELSDVEQLQLLIDYLCLSLFPTDYICTTVRAKSSAVLYYLFGVCIPSGSSSKKRLLLHDGWLEMWIIILSLASDVEKNPGPRQVADAQLAKVDNRVLGKQDLREVRDAVFDCRKCWFDLCLALRLSYNDLSAIRREHGGDTAACLREGLYLWLQSGKATWRALVDTVANSSGGNDLTLALEIARKHEAVGVSAQPSVNNSVPNIDPERGQEIIVAFANMCRSVTRLLPQALSSLALDGVLFIESDPLQVQATEENAVQSVMVSELHEASAITAVGGSTDRIQRRSQEMSRSSAFKSMYHSVISYMRGVDVEEIKGSLRYLTNPQCPNKLCVPPRVYKNTTSTEKLLDRLCPTYVNPEDTFVLEEIVKDCGSRRCKKELKDYTNAYF